MQSVNHSAYLAQNGALAHSRITAKLRISKLLCKGSEESVKKERNGRKCVICCASGVTEQEFDVSRNCVSPVFRSSPQESDATQSNLVKIIFLSEGNVCRSVYAESIFNSLINASGLTGELSCSSKATRDYNVGEGPDPRAVEVAQSMNLDISDDFKATMFNSTSDIVVYDLALVVDKFVAADVLKEVSVFDTINPEGKYSSKVRRLGDFCETREIGDIDDPLYGNMGGPEELENLKQVITDIKDSCEGLFKQLLEIKTSLKEGQSWKAEINEWLRGMEELEWMVPPMLQKNKT